MLNSGLAIVLVGGHQRRTGSRTSVRKRAQRVVARVRREKGTQRGILVELKRGGDRVPIWIPIRELVRGNQIGNQNTDQKNGSGWLHAILVG